MQMAGPRGLPASDMERNEDRATANPLLQTTSSLLETPNAGSGRRSTQQVLHILLPATRPDEVGCTADLASLEQASGVSFLQSHGKTCVPGIQECNFAPMARRFDLRIAFCNGVNSTPEPLQCLRTPAPESFDREWDQPTSRKEPSGVAAVLPVRSPGRSCTIGVCANMEPSAALRVCDADVPVD